MKSPVLPAALLCCAVGSVFAAAKTIPGQAIDQALTGPLPMSEFGRNAAIVGDVNGDGFADLLVGAPLQDNGASADAGAATLYPGTATGFGTTPIWSVVAQQANGQYGTTVAGIGDVNGDGYADFAVGAPMVDNGQTDEGGVYVYLGGTTIPTSSNAFLESNQVSGFLGSTLAGGDVNGDGYSDVISGAPGFDTPATNGGLAGVWFGTAGNTFEPSRDLSIQSSQVNARLGTSVAFVGDFNGDGFGDFLVGAPDYDDGSTDEGAAFLYFGGASPNIGTDGHFQINQASADFGRAVAGAGDVNGDGYADILVGAPEWDDGQSDEGGAFVYHGGPTVDTTADFVVSSNQATAHLGAVVAGLGDVDGDGYADIGVAAPLFDGVAAETGLVQVYSGRSSGVSQASVRSFEGAEAGEEFGRGLAGGELTGDGFSDLVVGAPRRDDGALADAGRISLARGGVGLPDTTADVQFESDDDFSYLGAAMATGDLNGDGLSDLAVGAPQQDAPGLGAGRVHLFLSSAAGIPAAPTLSLTTNRLGGDFGRGVAIGDLNGDGFGDLIVGASGESNGEGAEGRVHVYFGAGGAFDTTIDRTFEVNQGAAGFGRSVAFAGDMNGDGFGDLAVGAPLYETGQTDEGSVFVFLGSGNLDTEPDARMEMNQGSGFLGISVAGIGDLNGDGFADIAAGANGFDVVQGNDGAAFVWFGGATLDQGVDRIYNGDQLDGRMGVSVAGVGDVNGDGYDDFVVGAPEQNVNGNDTGAAFVFLGAANPSNARHATLSSQQAGALDGTSVAAAGDVNQDGFADVWVGATGWDNVGGMSNQAGAAFLYLGGAGNFNTGIDLTVSRTTAFEELGKSIASGDFDGDGDSDMATGIWQYNGGQSSEGAVQVFLNGTSGRPVATQSFSDAIAGPVEQWGKSTDGDGFTVATLATSPFATERARLQVESCPPSRPFGHASCTIANGTNWLTVSSIGGPTELVAEVGGLPFGSLQHWRARVQFAPQNSGANGATMPIGPRNGPWRRMNAEPILGDIRITDAFFGDGFE